MSYELRSPVRLSSAAQRSRTTSATRLSHQDVLRHLHRWRNDFDESTIEEDGSTPHRIPCPPPPTQTPSSLARRALRAASTSALPAPVSVALSTPGQAWLDRLDAYAEGRSNGSTLRNLPQECIMFSFEYLNARMLCAVLPLVSRRFGAIAKHPFLWKSFVLRDLVLTSELPTVSTFIVLSTLYSSEREHKEHFWMRQFAERPLFAHVACVDLSTCGLSERAVRRALGAAKNIKSLRLSHCDSLTDDVLRAMAEIAIARADNFRLTELDVSYCTHFSSDALVPLLESVSRNADLAVVDLSGCDQLVSEDIGAILRATPHLRQLSCRATHVNATSLTMRLGVAPLVSQCKVLNLSHCAAVDDDCLVALGQVFPHVEELCLSDCLCVTSVGLLGMISGLGDSKLKRLLVDGCLHVDDVGFKGVAERCPRLEVVHMDRCRVTGQVLFSLLRGCDGVPAKRLRLSVVNCLYLRRDIWRDTQLKAKVLSLKHCFTAQSLQFLEVVGRPRR